MPCTKEITSEETVGIFMREVFRDQVHNKIKKNKTTRILMERKQSKEIVIYTLNDEPNQ